MWWLAVPLLLLAADGGTPALHLDPEDSELYALVHKDGLAAAFAHNHVVRASAFTGELVWDPAHLERCRLTVTVAANDLVVDEPQLRRTLGPDFAAEVSGTDRASVLIHMLGRAQLDAKRFPTLRFESTRFARAATGALEVDGTFTLHGVSRPVHLEATLSGPPDAPVGEARLKLKTSDYGVTPYVAALGTLRNKDEVELVLKLATTASAAR